METFSEVNFNGRSNPVNRFKKGPEGSYIRAGVFDDMRRRLQDIGLIEGTVVECVGKSPLGDPCAYVIRGAVIALRSEDPDV